MAAYARRLAGPGRADRLRAARDWIAWEDALAALDPGWAPAEPPPDDAALTFATLVTHCWANDGFLRGDRAILARMGRIAHVPAVLVHGRRDLGSPAVTPWRLHWFWPASRLVIVDGDGHGGPGMTARLREGIDALAR